MKKLLIVMVVVSLALMGCQQTVKEEAKVETPKVEAEESAAEAEKEEESKEEDSSQDNGGYVNPVAGVVISDIDAKDVNGNVINAESFQGKKVTVLNLWGTFCGPCIEEMPDLQKIADKYKDKDVQVIGIIGDNPTVEDAKALLDQLKVTYVNVMPDPELMEQIVKKFDYVPATLFLDSEGKVLETFIPGGANEETFSKIIDKLLGE